MLGASSSLLSSPSSLLLHLRRGRTSSRECIRARKTELLPPDCRCVAGLPGLSTSRAGPREERYHYMHARYPQPPPPPHAPSHHSLSAFRRLLPFMKKPHSPLGSSPVRLTLSGSMPCLKKEHIGRQKDPRKREIHIVNLPAPL